MRALSDPVLLCSTWEKHQGFPLQIGASNNQKFAQPAETTGSALNVRIRRSLPRKGQDMHRLLCTSRRQ